MTTFRRSTFYLCLILLAFFAFPLLAQHPLKTIPLPGQLNSVNDEYSGMAWSGNRLYLLPQYGDHKETLLNGPFKLYSFDADSIARVIDAKDSSLTAFKVVKVKNLDKLPDSVKKFYQGFEAITFHKNEVFLAMETDDKYDYCFIIKGTLDEQHQEITIDPVHIISLKRYPYISNAGFESLTYLPRKKKLLAMFEFNAMHPGGIGYLIDPAFTRQPNAIPVPYLPFRLTDIHATPKGRIFGINYYWEGDYITYLNNNFLRNPEIELKKAIPDLTDSLKTTSYARIVTKKDWRSNKWEPVTSFAAKSLNWEGLALYRNGALLITDANRSRKLHTTLAFLEF
jgi:hypothetical protein